MYKLRIIFVFVAMILTQNIYADDKSCGEIANACLAAGFVKGESDTKGIWHDCMKPVILGKSVAGVSVNSSIVKSCRMHKIAELKVELNELQKSK